MQTVKDNQVMGQGFTMASCSHSFTGHRRGEGVVDGVVALLVLVPLEHGEGGHPQEVVGALLEEAQLLAQVHAQVAQRVVEIEAQIR